MEKYVPFLPPSIERYLRVRVSLSYNALTPKRTLFLVRHTVGTGKCNLEYVGDGEKEKIGGRPQSELCHLTSQHGVIRSPVDQEAKG